MMRDENKSLKSKHVEDIVIFKIFLYRYIFSSTSWFDAKFALLDSREFLLYYGILLLTAEEIVNYRNLEIIEF